jgi:E3 ubiquitin-protein ligase RBBP6
MVGISIFPFQLFPLNFSSFCITFILIILFHGACREQYPPKRGQGSGRFTSGRNYGREVETPPLGYICRSCGVPGHFIQHCPQESKTPPPGYICYRCRIPGHFIHHCPTNGDPKFDNNKMSRSLAPVVTVSPDNGILESLVPDASASAVDDLPAELHCRLCKKVMVDAVLTSKCCFDSFCDKCKWFPYNSICMYLKIFILGVNLCIIRKHQMCVHSNFVLVIAVYSCFCVSCQVVMFQTR